MRARQGNGNAVPHQHRFVDLERTAGVDAAEASDYTLSALAALQSDREMQTHLLLTALEVAPVEYP